MSEAKLRRCPWPGNDPLYIAYHDDEWGVPERDDRALYEKLVLDGFQAGLSWITILRKREAFRRAFDDFAPEKIARYTSKKVDALMQDEASCAIARRSKARSPRRAPGSRSWSKSAGFSPFSGNFVDGKPIVNRYRTMSEIPAETEMSRIISKELKAQRLQVLRADDRLRLHAGDRHGQRPPDLLPPSRGLRKLGRAPSNP